MQPLHASHGIVSREVTVASQEDLEDSKETLSSEESSRLKVQQCLEDIKETGKDVNRAFFTVVEATACATAARQLTARPPPVVLSDNLLDVLERTAGNSSLIGSKDREKLLVEIAKTNPEGAESLQQIKKSLELTAQMLVELVRGNDLTGLLTRKVAKDIKQRGGASHYSPDTVREMDPLFEGAARRSRAAHARASGAGHNDSLLSEPGRFRLLREEHEAEEQRRVWADYKMRIDTVKHRAKSVCKSTLPGLILQVLNADVNAGGDPSNVSLASIERYIQAVEDQQASEETKSLLREEAQKLERAEASRRLQSKGATASEPAQHSPKNEKRSVKDAKPTKAAAAASAQQRGAGKTFSRKALSAEEREAIMMRGGFQTVGGQAASAPRQAPVAKEKTYECSLTERVTRWDPSSYQSREGLLGAIHRFPDQTLEGKSRYREMNTKQLIDQQRRHHIPGLETLCAEPGFFSQYAQLVSPGSCLLLVEDRVEDHKETGLLSLGYVDAKGKREIYHSFIHPNSEVLPKQNTSIYNHLFQEIISFALIYSEQGTPAGPPAETAPNTQISKIAIPNKGPGGMAESLPAYQITCRDPFSMKERVITFYPIARPVPPKK